MLALSFFRFLRLALFCCFAAAIGAVDAQAEQVRLTNLTNVAVPLWISGDPTIIQTVLVCVFHDVSRNYGITALGSGPGFFLNSGTDKLPYTVSWNDGGAGKPNGGTLVPLQHNVKRTSRNNARTASDAPSNSTNCNNGASPTAQLTITISNTAMDAARDGAFSGTLTLIVSPD